MQWSLEHVASCSKCSGELNKLSPLLNSSSTPTRARLIPVAISRVSAGVWNKLSAARKIQSPSLPVHAAFAKPYAHTPLSGPGGDGALRATHCNTSVLCNRCSPRLPRPCGRKAGTVSCCAGSNWKQKAAGTFGHLAAPEVARLKAYKRGATPLSAGSRRKAKRNI